MKLCRDFGSGLLFGVVRESAGLSQSVWDNHCGERKVDKFG